MKVRPGEIGVGLVDEHDAARRQTARDSFTSSTAPTVPVGLFGLVRNTIRVRWVMAPSTSSSGKAKSRLGRDADGAASGDDGVELENLERRLRDDRLRGAGVIDAPHVRDRGRHDAFVEAVGQRQPR